jgi:MFS family permease
MTNDLPSIFRIAFASFIGTAIEFYDFYIYGLAVAMVIGPVFFPNSDPTVQALNAFLTFGIAFVARPIGALLFGHFGDRIGRKTTLAISLLVMGTSTTLIGVLPGYALIGWSANGEARRCWPQNMHPKGAAAGSACSRNWARRSGFYWRSAAFCCSRKC